MPLNDASIGARARLSEGQKVSYDACGVAKARGPRACSRSKARADQWQALQPSSGPRPAAAVIFKERLGPGGALLQHSRNHEALSMPVDDTDMPDHALALLVEEVRKRASLLTGRDRGEFVGSELLTVDRALSRIRAEGLARGPVFCEWGSGLGGACGVAALHGFTSLGIEIRREFVDAARALAEQLSLSMVFAEGTFLLPGDEDLIGTSTLHTERTFDSRAWDEMDLAPADCDVVFAYPWPGEEAIVDGAFARHASPKALLMTFHGFDRVLVQRKRDHQEDLQTLGWM